MPAPEGQQPEHNGSSDIIQEVINLAQLLVKFPNLQMPGLPMPNSMFPNLPMNPIAQQNQQFPPGQPASLQVSNLLPPMYPNPQQLPLGSFPTFEQLLFLGQIQKNIQDSWLLRIRNQLPLAHGQDAVLQEIIKDFKTKEFQSFLETVQSLRLMWMAGRGMDVSHLQGLAMNVFPTPSPSTSSSSSGPVTSPPSGPRPIVRRFEMAPRSSYSIPRREAFTERVSDVKWQEIVDYCQRSAVYTDQFGGVGLEGLINPAGPHTFPQPVRAFPNNVINFYRRVQVAVNGRTCLWRDLSNDEQRIYKDYFFSLKNEVSLQKSRNWIQQV